MSKIADGGPAFPVVADSAKAYSSGFRGMTLRDYFAAKAMQAFLSGHIARYGHDNHWRYMDLPAEAYQVADAMLKARGTT